jgi:F-type H+-transporting ATPase subunit b
MNANASANSGSRKRSRVFFFSSIFLLVGVAFPAFAADAEGGSKLTELIWQAVNLLILLGVLFAVARKPISAYFDERRKQIQDDIATADKLFTDSKRQFAEWQGKIVDLEGEIANIHSETRRRAEEEREQIIAAAHDRAERIKSDAVAAIDQELRRAQEELREEAATLAVDLATQMLDEQVDDRDRDRLLDEFITHVKPNGSGNSQNNGSGS